MKSKIKDALLMPCMAFLACFALSFVAGSLVIQPQASKAVTGLGLVGSSTMTLSSNTQSLSMNIVPTAGVVAGSHTLTATTNNPAGYSLQLQATNIPAFVPIAGTVASPIALADNTWGYALTRTGSTGAVGVTNGFDASYATPTPSAASKWANPTASAVLKNTTDSSTNDQTNVYFGAKVNMGAKSGTYASVATYTATGNMSSLPAPTIISVTPNSGTTAGGTAVQIVGIGFTMNDESITTAVTVGGNNCTNVSISSNTPTTGRDTITCNTAAHAAGVEDVTVTTWRSTALADNSYTYVAPAVTTFVSPSLASTIAGTESGPAFTVVGTGFTGATWVTIGGTACASFEVISDTQVFCEAPSNINITGSKAVVVTKTLGTGTINGTSSANVTYNDTAYPTLQANDVFSQCTTTAKLFRDTRDSQLYYVKKMPDNKCWMVDNLKYANYGDLSQEAGKYLTVDGTSTQSTANSDVAKYVDPGATSYCTGNTDIPANTNTRCGLLYNWYAATNGTGTYVQSTNGTNVTGSICPANFRLPSGTSDGTTATGNGTSYTAADFAVLNASMNSGSLVTGSTSNYYTNWQPSGAWGGVFSGSWSTGFDVQGSDGYFWSSTVESATYARGLYFYGSMVYPGSDGRRYLGGTVRCVMEDPNSIVYMQDITTANCPTTRTRANDKRDDASYWVQKLSDGRCWMLTNLAYGGGGTNTYGDVKSITNSNTLDYTKPYYMVPTGSNRTVGTTDPSTSTDGTGQYGYLYNYCAAMGVQTGTYACSDDDTLPGQNDGISICPSGWRIPTLHYNGDEYGSLLAAIQATNSSAGSTTLRSTWLAMYGGNWLSGFAYQGSRGLYWSSQGYYTNNNGNSVYPLRFDSSEITTSEVYLKRNGLAVRCIAV